MTTLRALPLGASLCLSTLAGAQEAPFAALDGYDRIPLYGSGGAPLSFGASIAAELTGDGDLDAAVLADGELFLLRNPGLWSSVLRYRATRALLDLAVLPRAHGSAAGLLATDGDALQLLRVVDGDVLEQPITGAWLTAEHLAARPLGDPLAGWTMVAFHDPLLARVQVVFLEQGLTAPALPSVLASLDFPLNESPLDLTLVRYDGDFLPEIGVSTSNGLRVYGAAGQLVDSVEAPCAFASVAAVDGPGGTEHLAALLRQTPLGAGPGDSDLLVLAPGQLVGATSFTADPTGLAVSTEAGAPADLIVGEADAESGLWLDGLSAALFAAPVTFGSSALGTSGGVPVAASFDFDGKPDVLLFSSSGDAVLYTTPHLQAPGPEGISEVVLAPPDGLVSGDVDEVLELRMCPTEQFPDGTDELEVRVWAWQSYGEHDAFYPEPMGALSMPVTPTDLPCAQVADLVVDVPLDWPFATRPDVYGIQLRMLKNDTDGPVRLAAKQFLYTTDCEIFGDIVGDLPDGYWSVDPCGSGFGGVHAPGIIRVPRFGIVFDDEHEAPPQGVD
ncbi:MAG: hypothetical protein AAF682_27360 [Planctomycetota bacterium]